MASATSATVAMMMASKVCDEFKVGAHISKKPSLTGTILSLSDYTRPYQIFLGNPQSTRLSITDADLNNAAKVVARTGAQIYIHSQYIINLAQPTMSGGSLSDPLEKSSPDGFSGEGAGAGAGAGGGESEAVVASSPAWHTTLLIKNLQYGARFGAKGVVVHVGKSVKMPLSVALENMRANLLLAIPHATEQCPILLETPAGQGTEMLTDVEEFIDFVASFGDVRLRACIDTCHIFVCGYDPMEYIERFMGVGAGAGVGTDYRRDLLKLIHFNDSAAVAGSRKDRHAFVGTGHIGLSGMSRIAECCSGWGLPMVIE